MADADYRRAIIEYIRAEAQPVDKFTHQARLYPLAKSLAGDREFDDDVLFAAAWMHDLGVFVGHRPSRVEELANWDHIAYAARVVPGVLEQSGFPFSKVEAVLDAIRTHLPSGQPASFEAILLRDADILEQLGAVGILRMVSKVGRDTRFPTLGAAVAVLRKSAANLPAQLKLPSSRRLAEPRLAVMAAFLQAAAAESGEGGL